MSLKTLDELLDEIDGKNPTNPTTKFEIWLNKVNEERKKEWDEKFSHREYRPLTYTKGRKYIKIIDEGSVWGFVCMENGTVKGFSVKKGDLLKAASWNSPAKHARGNIFEGTERYSFWGPEYLTN